MTTLVAMKEEWRFAIMENGELYVIISGAGQMPWWCVDSWDYHHCVRHIYTSGMLSIVGEWESAHAKFEARTALQYIYIYREREKIARSHH